MGSTDCQRVEFLPKVFYGKRCRFAGRGPSSRTPANSGLELARIGSLLFTFADSASYQIGSSLPIGTYATRLSAEPLSWKSTASEEVQVDMSIFPTKVLLATDGSKEADLAGRSAAELADETGSELHVVHVLALPIDTQDPSRRDKLSCGDRRL